MRTIRHYLNGCGIASAYIVAIFKTFYANLSLNFRENSKFSPGFSGAV
jgi:hypothetical protein